MNQQRKQMCHGFLFPKGRRYLYETVMLLFALGLGILFLLAIAVGDDMRFVCSYGCILVGIAAGILTVNNFRFRAIRFATYSITEETVSLQYGRKQISLQRCGDYRLSLIHLTFSSGKGSPIQEPYIVFWKDTPPSENINPLKMIKSGSFLLLPGHLLNEVKRWCGTSEIPQYPDYVTRSTR